MDWLRIALDDVAFPTWCMLTSEIGKPIMGLVGLGGITSILRSLYTLPIPQSPIVTERNKKRRYRRRTVALGWLAVVCLALSVGAYLYATNCLRTFGKVCDMNAPPQGAAIAVTPFLVTTVVGLILLASYHARAFKLKGA
jgi:phosphate/sulfate permease